MLERDTRLTSYRFDQLADQINERVIPAEAEVDRYVGLEHLDSDSLRIRRWANPSEVESTKLRFQPGDIIFGKRRVYQRKVAVADTEGICSAHAMVLRAKPEVIVPEFLPFFMKSDEFMERALSISVGSLSPTINWKALAQEEFLLPPIQEQARSLEALRAAADFHSRLYDLEEAVKTGRLSAYNNYFVTARRTKVNTCVGEVATIRNGTTPSRTNPDFWEGDVPWLPTGKVNDRYISSAVEYITQEALAKCALRMIPAKSTLVAMIGQGTTRGKSAFLQIDSTINQNFAAVTPGPEIMPEYLFYQLDACYEPLRHWSHGSNQHALNTKLIGEFPIWVPDDGTQREVSEAIAQLETGAKQTGDRIRSFRSVYECIAREAFDRG